jgi:ring-1,2-phenylacetyl-CoA epoxidase subunit PaaB
LQQSGNLQLKKRWPDALLVTLNFYTMENIFRRFLYGDYGDREPAKAAASEARSVGTEWPLWEVFIRSKQGLDHKHVGSLHAADAKMAIENARDVYTRRQEGISIWVVESKQVFASNPDEADSFYDPANDKLYRHPTFYNLPNELKHM